MMLVVNAETARTLKDQIVFKIMSVLEGMPPGEVIIEIVRSRRRTFKMNRLYWKWVGVISSELGYSKNAMHEVFMHMAGFHDVVEIANQTHVIRWSSSKLSVEQFARLMEIAEEVALAEKITLPYPEELEAKSV